MEFWGIEVKAGQPIKTNPGDNYVIHLSQASLGESKNKAESVPLHVNVNGQKLVLGTLSHQNFPQLCFDLVFNGEFELSHNWKNGIVYFLGYKTFVPEEGDDEFDISSDEESSEEEEELPVATAENGKAKTDGKAAKANAVKQAVKIAEPSNTKKTEVNDDDSDSDEEDDSEDDDDTEDEDESDEMSMDDGSNDEDEETPKKVESNKKKRPAEAATPVSAKKAKSAVTPQKTDGKKGGHVATPHPSKQSGKALGKSPKSGGQFSCGSCTKSFGSEGGLDSHKKAKHGGK